MEEHKERYADFLFEVGTMRRLLRAHRQTLMTSDDTDNIASHSYRVAMIGWILAKSEKADPYQVVMMCLLHDMPEIRTGDHNWIHKRYVKDYEEEVVKDQIGSLPDTELLDFITEYNKRDSLEAIVAKDADLIDQVLLLKEYEHQGNREAATWLRGKNDDENHNKQLLALKTESGKKLGRAIFERGPSEWWKNIWTDKNR